MMISLKKIALLFILCTFSFVSFSQCAMCKAVVESSDQAEGINNGILYLMGIPYLLIGTVGYLIYRHYNKNKSSEEA